LNRFPVGISAKRPCWEIADRPPARIVNRDGGTDLRVCRHIDSVDSHLHRLLCVRKGVIAGGYDGSRD
jgi:hypothetical protein